MRLLIPILFLAACGDAPGKAAPERSNRAIDAAKLINSQAECISVALGYYLIDQADIANCALEDTVYYCTAALTTPLACKPYAKRQQPPKTLPAPVAAPVDGGVK